MQRNLKQKWRTKKPNAFEISDEIYMCLMIVLLYCPLNGCCLLWYLICGIRSPLYIWNAFKWVTLAIPLVTYALRVLVNHLTTALTKVIWHTLLIFIDWLWNICTYKYSVSNMRCTFLYFSCFLCFIWKREHKEMITWPLKTMTFMRTL